MSVRSFRPVLAVATVAAAALGCYLVSLRVATERSALEDVETKIVLTQRDIRTLQTEIGTRGRLAQLERWNVKVLALSAPKAEQFVDGGYQLARLARPSDQVNMEAPVIMASAPKPRPAPVMSDDDADVAAATTTRDDHRSDSAAEMLHVASYKVPDKPSVESDKRKVVPAPTKAPKIATAGPGHGLPPAHADAKAAPRHDAARPASKESGKD